MKVGKSIDNKQDKKPNPAKQSEVSEARRAILEKIQAKRIKAQQPEYVRMGNLGSSGTEKLANLPHSTRSSNE